MSNSTKVSVIIPVYNVAEYLPFAMQSCMDQTLRDVEFICVNDGSTDNSLEILNCYAKLDDRITVISKANGGVSSARNVGLSVATGDWIMFLDPDDCLAENACERVCLQVYFCHQFKKEEVNGGEGTFSTTVESCTRNKKDYCSVY